MKLYPAPDASAGYKPGMQPSRNRTNTPPGKCQRRAISGLEKTDGLRYNPQVDTSMILEKSRFNNIRQWSWKISITREQMEMTYLHKKHRQTW